MHPMPAGFIVAMETSSSAHHWARKLIALGLDARILAAQLVSPYRRQGSSSIKATGSNATKRNGVRSRNHAFA